MCPSHTLGLPAESGTYGWFCPACSLLVCLLCHEKSHWYSHGGVRNPHLKAYQVLLFWFFLLVQALFKESQVFSRVWDRDWSLATDRRDALMQGAGPVSPREGYLVNCGAGCPRECCPHPAVTAGGCMCAYSLGTIVLNPCVKCHAPGRSIWRTRY